MIGVIDVIDVIAGIFLYQDSERKELVNTLNKSITWRNFATAIDTAGAALKAVQARRNTLEVMLTPRLAELVYRADAGPPLADELRRGNTDTVDELLNFEEERCHLQLDIEHLIGSWCLLIDVIAERPASLPDKKEERNLAQIEQIKAIKLETKILPELEAAREFLNGLPDLSALVEEVLKGTFRQRRESHRQAARSRRQAGQNNRPALNPESESQTPETSAASSGLLLPSQRRTTPLPALIPLY